MSKQPSNRTPSYRLHKRSGQAVVVLSGHMHYLGEYGSPKSHEKYGRLLGQWIAGGRKPLTTEDESAGGISVAAIVNRYADFLEANYKPQSLTPVKHATRFLTPYARTPAAEFDSLDLEAVIASMVTAGLSRTTITGYVAKLKAMFRWACRQRLVPLSVHELLSTVDVPKRGIRVNPKVKPVADELVDRCIPHMQPVVADMVRLQRLTGCRPGEVCDMRPCDVDRSGSVWVYTPRTHKTQHHGHARRIFIGQRGQAILTPYLDRDPSAHCFQPAESETARRERQRATRLRQRPTPKPSRRKRTRAPGDRFTTGTYGRSIVYATEKALGMPAELRKPSPAYLALRMQWRKAKTPPAKRVMPDDLQAAELERQRLAKAWRDLHCWHAHQLRHSAATAIERTHGLVAAANVLGHASLDSTQIYAERDWAMAARVAAEVG